MKILSDMYLWKILSDMYLWTKKSPSNCHIGTLTPCIEAVAESCIIVTWWSGPGGIQVLSERPTGFLQCLTLLVWSYDL